MQNNARKNIIYSILLLLVVFAVFLYRQDQEPPLEEPVESDKVTLTGKTMGTSYRVVYLDENRRNLQASVDSLLVVFNQSLSTYIPESEISQLNRGDTLTFRLPFMLPVLEKSREIYGTTQGAFDPTVGPLVNAWGFGPGKNHPTDSIDVRQDRKITRLNSSHV